MSFFKPQQTNVAVNKSIARLHTLIWVLIYGGLLCAVLGLSVQRTNDQIGWSMVVIGSLTTALGCVLIYMRSKMTPEK